MEEHVCESPEATFELGRQLGGSLRGGDIVLLRGGLGAGKTLFTKGVLSGLGFDPDEVTSPSFTLVNLYKALEHNVYHIDLWRVDEGSDAAFAVGLHEILEEPNAIVIVEWAERLGEIDIPGRRYVIDIEGDGDDPRKITISSPEQNSATVV
ncbi:MAG: tRNA (adenosine(37)-N6)-threonylcarbamoyltransferase complex ATPase subunit type 1 TsaE [Pyrinomonadaceae bacterium]